MRGEEGAPVQPGAGRNQTMPDADRIDRLVDLCEQVIEVHRRVVMDTPEDRDLHDRAVATFREYLGLLRPAPDGASGQMPATAD